MTRVTPSGEDAVMTDDAAGFQNFSIEHYGLIAGFLVVSVAMVFIGRRHAGTPAEGRFCRGFALLILVFTVPLQILQLLPGDYSLQTSLPLQLCDLAWMAAALALWTRHWAPTALVYFWGLTLTIQGIITPALEQGFPSPRYLMFWGMHYGTVWAAVYLTFGLRVPVTWRSYRFAVLFTSGWVALMMGFNALMGTNYGFLNRKPGGASVLDLLGPWPTYVLVEIIVVACLWAALTWPWTRVRRPTTTGAEPRTART